MIICPECGFKYEETLASCPECGNPTPHVQVRNFVNTTGYNNCPHCGAPITNNITCEWCECSIPVKNTSNGKNTSTSSKKQNKSNNKNNNNNDDDDDDDDGIIGGIIGGVIGVGLGLLGVDD